jgi:isoleucyl-tRNA synthetase
LDEGLGQKWERVLAYRKSVNEVIEPLRREKTVRSSLEAEIIVSFSKNDDLERMGTALASELFIVSEVQFETVVAHNIGQSDAAEIVVAHPEGAYVPANLGIGIQVVPTENHKCGRCWRHLPEVTEDGDLCDRCEDILA